MQRQANSLSAPPQSLPRCVLQGLSLGASARVNAPGEACPPAGDVGGSRECAPEVPALKWLLNFLSPPKDDMVLEAAVASQSRYIITHNLRDFTGSGIEGHFGITPIRPREFLHLLRSREL
jgi:hypothetical protein